MAQHYIDEQTGEVFGYEKRAGLTPCEVPPDNHDWDTVFKSWKPNATAVEAKRISDIKAKAGELIITRMPEWKQRNYIARRIELSEIATRTAEEDAELAFIEGEWAYAKAIRQISNDAEAAGTLLVDVDWTVV